MKAGCAMRRCAHTPATDDQISVNPARVEAAAQPAPVS